TRSCPIRSSPRRTCGSGGSPPTERASRQGTDAAEGGGMRVRQLALVLAAAPLLVGFDGPEARDALDAAPRDLYQPDVLVAVELAIDEGHSEEDRVSFAYGRKTVGDETRTLVYTGDGRRDSARVLLFQKPGSDDRAFASEGDQGQVRPVPMGK